ncbi:MAG: hypothetical protein M3Y51_00240 [Actinomycetota bacterium]|nr:hypothetical protein [Actinomycetota bacterium]
MDARELMARFADHVDHHHPRLGSRLLRARYGGLRVTEPNRTLAAGVLIGGLGVGALSRRLIASLTRGRLRVQLWLVGILGPLLAWSALWRWDSMRWRRRHVVLVLDLPSQQLDRVVDELGERGLQVERWDGPRGVGGASTGLSCRLGDLRRVNAGLDELAAAPPA